MHLSKEMIQKHLKHLVMQMARLLAFAVPFFVCPMLSASVSAAVAGATNASQVYRLAIVLLVFVVVIELLLIAFLLRSRSQSQSVSAQLREDLRKSEEKFSRELGGRLIQAQEVERARIARELHDDINQRLALLANGLDKLGYVNGGCRTPEQIELHDLWQLTREVATDIQHLSHQLHPSKLQYLGLAAAARDLCYEFARQYEIEVECNVRNLPQELSENVSLSLFRTIQESLRNIAKHSHARHVKVELSCESAVVRLRVSDDGIGFDPDHLGNHHGLGLVSMSERLKASGGQFCIWSRPGLGTQVEGSVPVILKRPQTRSGFALKEPGSAPVTFDSSRIDVDHISSP